jgi:hypothetical protein
VPADFRDELGMAFFGFGLCHVRIVPCNGKEGKTFLTG